MSRYVVPDPTALQRHVEDITGHPRSIYPHPDSVTWLVLDEVATARGHQADEWVSAHPLVVWALRGDGPPREVLVQLAAVAVAAVEAIDRRATA